MNDFPTPPMVTITASSPSLRALLDAQRRAFLAEGPPAAEIRVNRIDRLIDLLCTEAEALVAAMRKDFGHRSWVQSMATDAIGLIPSLKLSRDNVKRWMKPTRRSSGIMSLLGARAWIEWQPRGVVGVISPWNFPVALSLQPAAQALAAGNRVMLKLSEFAPHTAEVLQRSIAQRFDPAEVVTVTGGVEIGAEFSRLPFDHLLFTGATSIGRHVQRAAAENLVPVTLELGGKSPAVVAPDADLHRAAKRIAVGKLLNAGQICVAPDYVFVPAGRERTFVKAFHDAVATMLPRLLDNDDYTSIVNEHHYLRLLGYLDDARTKGAEIIEINSAQEDFTKQLHHKIAPTMLLNLRDDMRIQHEEIFGPLLPVMTYGDIGEVITYINARPRALGAYYFGGDTPARRRFLAHTTSGGVTINDVLMHCANENLPFGGVGDSGMGAYHGRDGFETLSHGKAVQCAPIFSANRILQPPYGPRLRKLLSWSGVREGKAAAARLAK